MGLSQIENEMKDFKSGAKKQEMTLFWHKLIQTQTDKFLISYNYGISFFFFFSLENGFQSFKIKNYRYVCHSKKLY